MQEIETIRQLISAEPERFGHYQAFPDAALSNAPALHDIGYTQRQIKLDHARLDWLRGQFDERDFQLLEIGANLGFFSITLAAEQNATATIFEPIESYAKICKALAVICQTAERLNVHARGLLLQDLSNVSNSDLIINLNVLHHGGYVFDQAEMERLGGWHSYARAYLDALSYKSRYLIFQTGNKSHGPAYFESEDAIPYVSNLLEEASWQVKGLGVIGDFNTMQYESYGGEHVDQAPATRCFRNPETNQVDYVRNGEVVASLPKGLAQRPLWFCQSIRSR